MKTVAVQTAAALALLASGSVFAQGSPLLEDIAVTAEVTDACSALTATDVDFGSDFAKDASDDATATITVTCSSGVPYTVELDYGMDPIIDTPPIRRVTGASPSAGQMMDYYIFQDSNRTIPWGTIAQGDQLDGTGTGAADPVTAYFRLERNSGAGPGVYSDLVGVTLNF